MGKPYEQMDDLGGFSPYFRKHPYIENLSCFSCTLQLDPRYPFAEAAAQMIPWQKNPFGVRSFAKGDEYHLMYVFFPLYDR